MGYILWGYQGSGNHGCEDWLRGVCTLIHERPRVYSHRPEEDLRYGVGELCGIIRYQDQIAKEASRPGDCWMDLNLIPHDKKSDTFRVLWGWSGDPLTKSTLRKLRKYDALVVTESRSFRQLLNAGFEDKLHLLPEPALLVSPSAHASAIPLPDDTIGLCLSYPGDAPSALYKNYIQLIQWILKETSFSVALIPYCVQKQENDLLLQSTLYRQFRNSGRVFLRKDGSSTLLRGDLSMCRYCIGFCGAVAAWGCGVPALCLLENCKHKGLSKDIWGNSYENVSPWGGLLDDHAMTNRFRLFLDNAERNRQHLFQYLTKLKCRRELIQNHPLWVR